MNAHEREAERCTAIVKAEMDEDTAAQISKLSLDVEKFSLMRDALNRMEQPISRMKLALDRVEDHLDSLKRREILDWLSSQPYVDHHTAIRSRVLKGTGQWIVQHPDFNRWKNESTNTLLWLHGTQGAGKSCLASIVVEENMRVPGLGIDCALAYFYCSRSTAEPQRGVCEKILACLARQLSSPSSNHPLAPATLALNKKLRSADGSRRAPTAEELCNLIVNLTEMHARNTIVVDALDECSLEERGELVDALQTIVNESTSLVKVFVSSREEGDLRLSLQTHTGVQLTSLENAEDIRKFVEFETDRLVAKNQLLAHIRRRETKDALKELIKQDVIAKANGMFRWAELQLQSLRWIRLEKDIRHALSQTPRALGDLYEDLYQRALENTKDTDQAILRNTLKWMLCAEKVLTQDDFLRAVTAFLDIDINEIDEELVLDLLSNFVVRDTDQGGARFFRFTHLSVREFLETKPEFSIELTNTFAAEVTLLTLIGACGSPKASQFLCELGLDFIDIAPYSEVEFYERGIHNYSLQYWNSHCYCAGQESRSAEDNFLAELLGNFLFDSSDENCPLNCWTLFHEHYRLHSLFMSLQNYQMPLDRAFLLSCAFGFEEIIRMEEFHDLDDDVKEQCAIEAAIHYQRPVLEFIIYNSSDALLSERILQDYLSNNFFTSHIQADVVRWLLDYIVPGQLTETIISYARYQEEETINLLIDHMKNPPIIEMIRKWDGPMPLLNVLLKRAPNAAITSRIIEIKMEDVEMDFDSMKALVERADHTAITCHVISQAASTAGKAKSGGEENWLRILQYLLQRAGPIRVTERSMIRLVSQNESYMAVKMVLDHDWPVTQKILQHAAQWGTPVCFSLLLGKIQGEVTPRLLEASAGNSGHGCDMVQLHISLLKRPPDDKTWASMILKCAWVNNDETQGPATIKMLLDMKPHMRVRESVLLGLIGNILSGNRMLAIVLDEDRELEITERVIEDALLNMTYDELISRLLDRHGAKTITNRMMLGAVRSRYFGNQKIRALMRRNSEFESPSMEVINAAIENAHSGFQSLQALEERFGKFFFTDRNVESAAAGSLKTLKWILHDCTIQQAPSSLILTAASRGNLEVMKYLLQLNHITVTSELMVAAATNRSCGPEMLRMLWSINPTVEISIDMFRKAAECDAASTSSIRFLVRKISDVRFAEHVLSSAVGWTNVHERSRKWVVEGLLENGPPIIVGFETIMDVIKGEKMHLLQPILHHGVGATVSQDMIDVAVQKENLEMLEILTEYGNGDELDMTQALEILYRLSE